MTTYARIQETTFIGLLQASTTLDLRDKRGQRHDISFILLMLILSLFRNRDGNLSSIHRCMVNMHNIVCRTLGLANIGKPVSRSHLPVLLSRICLDTFESILFRVYQVGLSDGEKKWFSGDGKECRGSIASGDKRGDAFVQAISHDGGQSKGQLFFSGLKDSEKTYMQYLLSETGLKSQKITMDALHFSPKTTQMIESAGGTYIIGLKENQPTLFSQMAYFAANNKQIEQLHTKEKGHGRIDTRHYELFEISNLVVAPRWTESNFSKLIKVYRKREYFKTGKIETKTSYYISNGTDLTENYFQAIRRHWQIEVNNHIRDVTFKEDRLKTKITEVTQTFAGLRTIAIELLRKLKPKSMIAQLEYFQDNPQSLFRWLKAVQFL